MNTLTNEPIRFYRVSEAFGEFSNFAGYPIQMRGKTWRTTEHYFQGQKFVGTPSEEEIRLMKSPMVAARAGRSRKRPLRKDWESKKDQIMEEAVRAKFTQHVELRELLVKTGSRKLIEHTTNDSYWGDGGDGTGLNKLGVILMKIRNELQTGGEDGQQPNQS